MHGDNNREELWIESRSQLNKATSVIPAVLKIDGTKHLEVDKQANLLLFSPLGHNCDFKFDRHSLKDHPMQSTFILQRYTND